MVLQELTTEPQELVVLAEVVAVFLLTTELQELVV